MATPKKKPEDLQKVGRKSKYKPVYCKRIVEWAKQGKLPLHWANKLEVVKQTLFDWQEAYPRFLDAYGLAKQLAEQHYLDKLNAKDITMVQFNSIKFQLSAYFKVSEVQKIEAKQEINAKVTTEAVLSFDDAPENNA